MVNKKQYCPKLHIVGSLYVTDLATCFGYNEPSSGQKQNEVPVHSMIVHFMGSHIVHNLDCIIKTKSMAVCGNYIQRVKIVINNDIVEHVTDFKYLGYRISEYKSDLEDKLQTYNKINGAIRRHFGKQLNKET